MLINIRDRMWVWSNGYDYVKFGKLRRVRDKYSLTAVRGPYELLRAFSFRFETISEVASLFINGENETTTEEYREYTIVLYAGKSILVTPLNHTLTWRGPLDVAAMKYCIDDRISRKLPE